MALSSYTRVIRATQGTPASPPPKQMNADSFLQLLARHEGPTLDFKAEDYDFDIPHKRGEFLKDVLAMANTPRDQDALIVLGVKKHRDGRYELPGLPAVQDDNDYQQQLGAADPTPGVHFEPVHHEGKLFGVITVAVARQALFRATKDVSPVKKGQLYWRSGTRNTEVTSAADEEVIRRWVHKMAEEAPPPTSDSRDEWSRFSISVSELASSGCALVLVAADDERCDDDGIASIGLAPWFAVLDLDPDSAGAGGLASAAHAALQTHRVLHEVIADDRPTVHFGRSTYWFYARGLRGRAASLVNGDIRQWKQRYLKEIRRFLEELAARSEGTPVHLVCLAPKVDRSDALAYSRAVLSTAEESFGERTITSICGETTSVCRELAKDLAVANCFHLSRADLGRGCEQLFGRAGSGNAAVAQIPTRSGVPAVLEAQRRLWLEEELEIAYINAGLTADGAGGDVDQFLRGGVPTWFNLRVHDDVEREISPKLLRQLRVDLGLTGTHSPGTVRINLYHQPGAGGTSVARRILWSLREEVPCAIIKRASAAETTERVRELYKVTSRPVVLLVEGRDVTDTELDDLYTHLRAQQIPAVLLRVLRTFKAPKTSAGADGARAWYLPLMLTTGEAAAFAERYSRQVMARKAALEKIVSHSGDSRHPFMFGLVAFDEHFRGIAPFVKARLEGLTEPQATATTYLALAYYYGQKGIAAQAFAELFHQPAYTKVGLENFLAEGAMQLLAQETGAWRPIHHIVAEEVLKQSLNPAGGDPGVWRQNIAPWAMRFARFCRGTGAVASSDMVDLVSRCFVLRDSREFIGREETAQSNAFSRLVEDIPTLQGRFEVLELLTQLFPDEAHFWGHVGRFAFREMKDPARARALIDKGIELSPDDHVLYHIKGMAFRAECYELLESASSSEDLKDLARVETFVRQASEQFATARDMAPDDEHAYVSNVQMLIRVADALRRLSGATSLSSAIAHQRIGRVIREALDQAEDLLERARLLREGDRPSQYTVSCSADLDEMYGNYGAVLQAWDSLLQRSDVDKPSVRRQLVRAYLARGQRDWTALPQREIERSVELLEQNLMEEPAEERNLRLWVQAVRRLRPPRTLPSVIQRVAGWGANSRSVDAAYYLYVLYALEALDGSALALRSYRDALDDCKKRAKARRNRTVSFEWVGDGTGMAGLVHHSELGGWDPDTEFWSHVNRLRRVPGRIATIHGPESGWIEGPGGVLLFFVPGRANLAAGRDENTEVDFFLGFSYDGPRAWEVRVAPSPT